MCGVDIFVICLLQLVSPFVFAAISPTRSAKVVTKMNQFLFMHVRKQSQIHVLKSSLYRHRTWDSTLRLDWFDFCQGLAR